MRWLSLTIAVTVLAALTAATALGHTERPAYWPDPAADSSVKPATGGKVPNIRPLRTAVKKKPRGRTRVVCQRNSFLLAKRAIRRARKQGYSLRPSDQRKLTKKQAKRLLRLNKRLKKMCRYRHIQRAVTKSRNNDRVVIMPGLYTEPRSRAKPTNDPKCDQYETMGDRPNEAGALSYEYQVRCQNDQNLIAVMGREVGSGEDPVPPNFNRHGIPNLGKCIRCNVQIEGSGPSPDDVIIEAGDASKGDGGPSGVGSKKDVGIRADRADGFVLRNVKVRHAKEHGIYVLESDGYVLDRFKVFYNGLYGTLTFVEDHGVQQNCEGAGHGDSAIYPGASVETGEQRPEGTPLRYNQEIRRCDMHHNLAGLSATSGNGLHVHHNNFYDNSLGFQTDVVTGAGHPGYPGDTSLFEENNIYSNNFNPYENTGDVTPAFPFPVGTGFWIAGGNNHTVRNNRIWDNWRRGGMLFSVPDSVVCGPAAEGNQQAGCDPDGVSVSNRNRFYGNTMDRAPSGAAAPNGTDWWWDAFLGNKANCWYDNAGVGPITSEPPNLPDCDNGTNPDSSTGTSYAPATAELGTCLVAFETRQFDPETSSCPWLRTPAKPGTPAAAAERRADRRAMRGALEEFCDESPAETCDAFETAAG